MSRTVYPLNEKETGIYSFTLKDEAGTVVAGSLLSSARLTVYVPHSLAIVNGRNNQDVLNLNQVTISEFGVVTWTLKVEDVTILDSTVLAETHRCLFVFGWTSGGLPRSKPHEIDLLIQNLEKLS